MSNSETVKWHVTAAGYRRGHANGRDKPQVLEHVWVWEQAHGPIPAGYHLHHRDGDKLNNDLANLQLVTPTEHKRIHAGCKLRPDGWYKPCRVCGQLKRIDADNWYLSPEGWPRYGRCRPCHIGIVVRAKRARRLSRMRGTVQD